jgi:hypothetical protein
MDLRFRLINWGGPREIDWELAISLLILLLLHQSPFWSIVY